MNFDFDKSEKTIAALLAGLSAAPEAPCGGRGICGKCRVHASGALSPVTQAEQDALTEAERARGMRLACQVRPLGRCTVSVPSAGERLILTDGALPDFSPDPACGSLGLAVDLGTTTLAGYLYDLTNPARLSVVSARNPQYQFGADVISRLQKSLEGHAAALSECILRGIDALARDAAGDRAGEIDAIVITGNTAMLYLLTGAPPDSIARAPFEADRLFGETCTAAALGLTATKDNACVYLCRAASAYVGGDIAAAALAARMDRRGGANLLVDVGTNGEMVLSKDGRLFCCATAAGPAFEGAGIKMGSAAVTGAISRAKVEGGRIVCAVIGGGKAESICGSGIVDAVAALLTLGAMDETGRLDADICENLGILAEPDGELAARLADEVYITQKDIRAVQLAKAAICAGCLTLLQHAGLHPTEVDTLFLAGGFGSFLDPHAAEAMGLIPETLGKKAVVLGNAAGAGASMILLSGAERTAAEALAGRMEVATLHNDPYFQEQFISNMLFE